MLRKRIIPVLLISNGGVVKTKNFDNPRYIGDPVNAVKIFSEKEVDEIAIIDINASADQVEPNYNLIKDIASEAFMPFSYGGGVKKLAQAEKILKSGAEKIILNTVLFENIKIVKEMVTNFGRQSIVICLDIKKTPMNRYKLYSHIDRKIHVLSLEYVLEVIREVGVGEVIIQSVDRDGSMLGYDTQLLRIVKKQVVVPLIVLGGCGKLSDIREAIDVGADAVAVGSMFIFYGKYQAVLFTYPKYNVIEEILA